VNPTAWAIARVRSEASGYGIGGDYMIGVCKVFEMKATSVSGCGEDNEVTQVDESEIQST